MPNNPNTKLVDSKTIAAIFGVDPRRVQQLAKEGIITATKDGHANRYDLLPTIQKYIRYLSDKANGREPSKKDSEIEARRLEAEADLKRSKADMAALQLKQLEGTMHRSEDVVAVQSADGTVEIIRAEANRRDSEPPTPAAAPAVRHPAALTAA